MQTEQWNIQPMVGDFLTTLIQKSTGGKRYISKYIYSDNSKFGQKYKRITKTMQLWNISLPWASVL